MRQEQRDAYQESVRKPQCKLGKFKSTNIILL
jgi:hypothetical protein